MGAIQERTAAGSSIAMVTREACQYTAYYCEENAIKFVEHAEEHGIDAGELFGVPPPPRSSRDLSSLSAMAVVFISNKAKAVPLWCQRASSRADGSAS